MRTIIFLFLFSFSTISSVHASSGQEWLSECESDKTYKVSSCLGYLKGVRDMDGFNTRASQKLLFEIVDTPFSLICFPCSVLIAS